MSQKKPRFHHQNPFGEQFIYHFLQIAKRATAEGIPADDPKLYEWTDYLDLHLDTVKRAAEKHPSKDGDKYKLVRENYNKCRDRFIRWLVTGDGKISLCLLFLRIIALT